MSDKTPFEKLEEQIFGLSLERDVEQVPFTLQNLLALINGVDTEQMRKDLAPAIMVKGIDPDTGREKDVSKYAEGELAELDDIVVKARGDVPAQTVSDIIEASAGVHKAMARLMDVYIRLVVRAEIDGSSSSGAE